MQQHVHSRAAEGGVARVEAAVVLVRVPLGKVVAEAVLEVERSPDPALRHQVVDQAVRGIVPDRVTDSEDRGVARRLGGDPFHRDQVERERHLGHDVLRARHGARDIAVVQRRRDRNADDVGIGPERRLRVCEAADPEARGHLAAALHGRLVEHHLAGAERDQITKAAAAHGCNVRKS